LILAGVVVSSQTFRFDRKVAWTTAAIVLIQPLFALGITELFHMGHAEIHDITLISAIPGGFFGLAFGKSFNSTPETVSSALIASYCVVGIFFGWLDARNNEVFLRESNGRHAAYPRSHSPGRRVGGHFH
jgi:malonate transporter and related proteins